jgi:hypothetical protein
MYTINYITAFYIGNLRRHTYVEQFEIDPLYFIRIHKNFLDTCVGTHIAMGTFVVNDDIDEDVKNQIVEFVKDCKIPTTVIFRENHALSYGAWNDTIINSIDGYDYFFMLEDDYAPDANDFYIPYIEKIDGNVQYVCGLVIQNPLHAAHSNGVISKEACKKILETNPTIFSHLVGKDKPASWTTQLNFMSYYSNAGYVMEDITDKYFLKHMADHLDKMVTDEYGVPNARCLIPPILIGAQ